MMAVMAMLSPRELPDRPRLRVSATVLGAPDPRALAGFYERLLGWTRVADEPEWVMLKPPSGGSGLSFQYEAHYLAPVWPAEPGRPQMTSHLDIAADDLDAAVRWALDQGATLAGHQPQEEVRVLLDPAGHPFCLFPAPPA
jgi:catechol 2,3-dioxygenase-like lactoylglutathione lyase family enzyme